MFESIIEFFEWLWDKITTFFSWTSETLESLTGDSAISTPAFWLIYAALFVSVWFLPSKLGLTDYTLGQKILYSILFFVIDFIIVGAMKD